MQAIGTPIRQFVFSKFYHFLIVPFLVILFDQINVLNNPERGAITGITNGGLKHYLTYIFQQLYLFEIITFLILALLIRLYGKRMGLRVIKPGIKAILLYELKWLPLFLLSILIFGPITNFFRYLFLWYPDHGWALYFPTFFMTYAMYFNYLVPIVIWGYILININLLMSYPDQYKDQHKDQPGDQNNDPGLGAEKKKYLSVIEGTTIKGASLLSTIQVSWFEVEHKSYCAFCNGERYSIKKTISELETELDPDQFFKINRSQIVNLQEIGNYNYWEFEKYIIRLKGNEERDFIITRKRFKELKLMMEKNKSLS